MIPSEYKAHHTQSGSNSLSALPSLKLPPGNRTRNLALDLDFGAHITICLRHKDIEADILEKVSSPCFPAKPHKDSTGSFLSGGHGIFARFNGVITNDTRPGNKQHLHHHEQPLTGLPPAAPP